MSHVGDHSWRCAHHEGKFCPPEGCTLKDGCARKRGWTGERTPTRAEAGAGEKESE